MCVPLREVSTFVCIYSVTCACVFLLRSKVIFNVFIKAGQASEQKHSGRWSPLFHQYDTVGARMESFKKWPLSAESLSEAGFFN